MFWPSTIELRNFYNTTLGEEVRKYLLSHVNKLWDIPKNENVLGVGYTVPILEYYQSQSHSSNYISMTTPEMGIAHFPDGEETASILGEEDELPFPKESINRIIFLHSLEYSDYAEHMIHEAFRVLVPGGRIIMIIPHRGGVWSRFETNPFSYGHPFNVRQIRRLMRKSNFVTTALESTLFFPPFDSSMILRTSRIWECMGSLVLRTLGGGVLILEAEKQLYAMNQKYEKIRNKRRIFIPINKPAIGLKSSDITKE
ncbi:MAG: methyltransferase domain-containing protein [Rickettsiales bacterium]|nr:methyltransferase domain-containing protein [Rickettsiales bacterium]